MWWEFLASSWQTKDENLDGGSIDTSLCGRHLSMSLYFKINNPKLQGFAVEDLASDGKIRSTTSHI